MSYEINIQSIVFLETEPFYYSGKSTQCILGKEEKAKTLLQMFAQHNEQQYTTKCKS